MNDKPLKESTRELIKEILSRPRNTVNRNKSHLTGHTSDDNATKDKPNKKP